MKSYPNAGAAFQARMVLLKRLHARILGTWAALSALAGGLGFLLLSGEAAHFGLMSLTWGWVNGGIAAYLYYHHREELRKPLSPFRQLEVQGHAEKIILFNAGLDVAYILGGLALRQHGLLPGLTYAELWKGFGAAVILQGSFLLLQDSLFYALHVRNRNHIYPNWKKVLEPSNACPVPTDKYLETAYDSFRRGSGQ
jgi:hypothetical protein